MEHVHAAATAAIHFFPSYEDALARSVPAAPTATRCSACHLKDLCLPQGLGSRELQRLDQLMFARKRVREGQAVYREGEKFQYLYAVRSGTFKSSVTFRDGREHVTAFQMAGELMGLDGMADGRHATSALALEDAEVCAIPYAQLTELAAGSPELQRVISRFMSREIVREHSVMSLLGSMTADERVAAFLLNISQRMKARGYSPDEFHLRMSRADIGSYLGMKLETVSRTLSAFQQRGLLEVHKKHIRITNHLELTRAFEVVLQ